MFNRVFTDFAFPLPCESRSTPLHKSRHHNTVHFSGFGLEIVITCSGNTLAHKMPGDTHAGGRRNCEWEHHSAEWVAFVTAVIATMRFMCPGYRRKCGHTCYSRIAIHCVVVHQAAIAAQPQREMVAIRARLVLEDSEQADSDAGESH